MKRTSYAFLMMILVLYLALTIGLSGCAGQKVPENVNCPAEITWEVVPEAKLTQLDCAVGKHVGQPALIFTATVENPTNKPKRYRVNIFLEDMDKGSGHLVPRTGKPPALEPGKSATVMIPFLGVDKESKKVLIMISTASF